MASTQQQGVPTARHEPVVHDAAARIFRPADNQNHAHRYGRAEQPSDPEEAVSGPAKPECYRPLRSDAAGVARPAASCSRRVMRWTNSSRPAGAPGTPSPLWVTSGSLSGGFLSIAVLSIKV